MADVLAKLKRLGTKKKNDNSIYSMVSCSDLTPGSLEVWLDLPDEIKYDPALAPFKHLYEQHHGKLDETEVRDDRKIDSTTKIEKTELATIDGNSHDHHNGVLVECETKLMDSLPNDPETSQASVKGKSVRRKQLDRAARLVKLTALVGGWLFLTVALLTNNEQTETVMHTAIRAGEVKEYRLESTEDRVKLLVTLAGPFGGDAGNRTRDAELSVWLRRSLIQDGGRFEQNSQSWNIQLQPDYMLDFAPSVEQTRSLRLSKIKNGSVAMLKRIVDENDISNGAAVSLCMSITGNSTVPLTLSYQLDPLEESDGLIYASILLVILYGLIIFEIVNRTLAALLCSSLSIAVLSFAGARPSLPALVSWLDVETLLLLFSMMLLVAIMSETGLFDYLAVMAFELTGGRTWPLILCLCSFTAIFSTFLDNVTTILLMTPVTIRLCEVMQLNPIAILMATVIFSNIGGTATPVGDPPNVIIASHPAVLKANINFMNFTVHMGTGVLLVCVQTYLQLRFMFRDINKLRHSVPRDIQEMRQEIFVWKRAAASLSSYSQDEDIVRKALEKKVERLNAALTKKEAGGGNRKKDPKFCSTLAQMKQKYGIRDKQLLVKCTVSIMFVVIVFFLHAFPELQRLSLGWTALLGAILLLLLAERDDLEPILARVEWSTLLFFAALFVLMEALSKLGLIKWIGKQTEAVILNVNEESRLLVALMLVLWISGLASAFVDNIPLTTMMIRVTASLADPEGLNLPLPPLIWALSFGACLGGNGTLIGASANVVCAGVAEQHGYRFTFMQYFKVGFPIMIGNLIVVSVYLLLCHCVGHWH